MPFKDKTGAAALPTLQGGAVPVRESGAAPEVLGLILDQLRAVRLGLELLNDLKPGELLALAKE